MTHYDLKSDRSLQNSFHRGGRIVKWKRGTASMVPHVAELRLTVSAAAVGAALMFGVGIGGTAPAMAGTCVESLVTPGDFVCSGPSDGVGIDAPQVLNGAPVTVTTEAGFGLSSSDPNALEITGTDGTSFEDAQASNITGQENGIFITNLNSGSLSLISNGTVTGFGNSGIYALNQPGTLDLTISSNVADGGYYGIDAINDGTGALTITSTGMASGTEFAGIDAENSGTDLSIDAVETYGGAHGIRGRNNGSGALTIISTGMAMGYESNGITARNNAGTALTVDAVDTSGGLSGIFADNQGNGALTITSTGTATGDTYNGITATNEMTATDLSITAADTTGLQNGIYAVNLGTTGALTITSTGTATGNTVDGIFALNYASGTDLTINAADTSGYQHGIFAFNFGEGELTITSTGTATGTNAQGIGATNFASGTDLTVNAVDASGGSIGIAALNFGEGALSITSTGTATGDTADGIAAGNSTNGTDLIVNAADSNGYNNGILANNLGTDALTITSTGTATGTNANGIDALNSVYGTSLSITANDVTGGVSGIRALNYGEAGLTIRTTGDITGQTAAGIFAYNSANDVSASTETSHAEGTTISGATDGIYVDNQGGSLTIEALGTVIGEAGDGIDARNIGVMTTDLMITSNVASGASHGIYANNQGTGALTITSTGTATGTGVNGITAINYGSALTVNAVDTSGGDGPGLGGGHGIDAFNLGTGALTINSSGTATGTDFNGIFANNSAAGTSLSITAADATGGENGIFASNLGAEDLTISTTGDITGQSQAGIFAYNSANGVMTDHAEGTTIIGATDGIYVENLGGSLTIEALGTVIGETDDGIDARNIGALTTDLTITSNVASGANNGILAENNGTGALTITSTGTATGTDVDGINVRNFGTDLMINAVNVSGGRLGIAATNFGMGALTIASTDTTIGTLSNGISAFNFVAGTSLSITAADVTGGTIGISASNFGTAGLTISTTGDITGQSAAGIFAFNSANDVSASTITNHAEGTTITGATDGIYADNRGGSLTINALGTVIGQADDGIDARNDLGTSGLTITSNVATGAINGILASNLGTGALTINSTGTATGTAFDGIYADNSGLGTDLTVNAVDTSGGDNGINADNEGVGSLTITSTGTAAGTLLSGIAAFNSANGNDLMINAADTSGGNNGIDARNYGSGALTVTSSGTASGATSYGIDAYNSAAGTSLSITANDVTGGVDGINASQEGSGPASITTSGTVAGGTGNAITAVTTGTAITVNNSGTLESGVGYALAASGGVTDLTNSGTINGRVQLSAFDDVVLNTGTFNATMDSDLGTGNDLFTNEGTVAVGGNITLTSLEQFTNAGLIDMENGAVGGSLTIPGDYVGNDGILGFDVTFNGAGSADTLIISGAATGNTIFAIDDISTSPNFGNMVLVVDAGAGTSEDAFALSEESATIGFFAYSVFYEAADNDFFLTTAIGTPAFQTLKFMEGAQSLWYRSADAWAAHMASPNDSSASPAWMQIYGSVTSQDDSFEFASSGFTQNINLDYEQDYFGLQLGYELGSGVTGDGLLFGLTGGYLNSNLGFDGTADNVRYDAINIGAYAGFKSGRFFTNALVKYDFIGADVSARTAGYTVDLDGAAYGVRLEAGYRLGDEGFFVQPLASFEYQRANLDDFSALGADIDFDNFDGLRGMVGARLGGEAKVNGSNNLTYYLGGQAVHQSQTGDGLTLTSGASSIQIENRLSKTFGRFEMGLSIATRGGVTGFIEGNADISGDYTGYGGRGGLKVQF